MLALVPNGNATQLLLVGTTSDLQLGLDQSGPFVLERHAD
jgi:hypothetical protein